MCREVFYSVVVLFLEVYVKKVFEGIDIPDKQKGSFCPGTEFLQEKKVWPIF